MSENEDTEMTRQINLRSLIVKSKGFETEKYRLVEKQISKKKIQQLMDSGL